MSTLHIPREMKFTARETFRSGKWMAVKTEYESMNVHGFQLIAT